MPDGDVDVGVAGVPEEAGVTTATEALEVTGVVGVIGVFGDTGVQAACVTSEICPFGVGTQKQKRRQQY